MARHGSRFAARLRRGLGLRSAAEPAPPRGRGYACASRGSRRAAVDRRDSSAGEAELDTLRGELVRELDRLAEGDDGSASFRRIAS